MSLSKNLLEIVSHPTSLFALLALILFILFIAKVKNVKFNTHLITQIGIALALATILKIFRIYHLPQGGSVTLGSMIPIILMALLYGPEVGFITGFLYGIITLILDPYILQPVQVLFDYPLPFMALGLAGYFKNNKLLATFVAVFGRFICHFISGLVFFGSFAPKGMSPAVYSLMSNGIFLSIEGAICLVIIAALPIKQLSAMATKKIPQN
ncbi:proton-coupled thiamine transporter YuaJ [Clostridium carboxidivorans P7]|uniref:Proton-coupled thiamine transporter YuaJ n=1 Tax=Clostridium carboxidivorans P7 TaxID=536227 RepID=C6Q251_9CLOT|nr:energy-coupled thiamine transporter ThiT [Clostridium carboxidivorans]AKN33229.1 proton-coupled thiamine transporter YuaJ [Clostridium carboxidivorans P7]EET84436.1 proton-coupled thiamine transporter YuaJ [Clostridium carboxidivorans P7]